MNRRTFVHIDLPYMNEFSTSASLLFRGEKRVKTLKVAVN